MMEFLSTPNAPKAIGPYSQAIKTGNLIFCSGQLPLDPSSMKISGSTIEEQTEQVMNNIQVLLESEGLGLKHIVKTTIYLVNIDDFQAMNTVYEKCLNSHKPARAAVEVSRLPKGALVMVECIAVCN
jgi:2-iminobutanoate/2-iminopropanoate deaminase